jgi:hypothetical protein
MRSTHPPPAVSLALALPLRRLAPRPMLKARQAMAKTL